MKKLEVWHVRSNGIGFIIMNQRTEFIAEVKHQEHADRICKLVNSVARRRLRRRLANLACEEDLRLLRSILP